MSQSKSKSLKAPNSLLKGDLVMLSLPEECREEVVIILDFDEKNKYHNANGTWCIDCNVIAVRMTDSEDHTYYSCGEIINDWGFCPNDKRFTLLSRNH
jgi:hypothetical protein